MHPHPEWQRALTRGLREAFPKVQFIVASHSPQVIGELDHENVVLLTPDGAVNPSGSFGMTSNQVLQELMDAEVRATPVKQKLDEIDEALARNQLDQAEQKIQALASEAPRASRTGRCRGASPPKEDHRSMRYFVKKASAPAFEAWKAQANEDWSPSYAALAGTPKQALLQALLEEQGHVCCYCGRSIDERGQPRRAFPPAGRVSAACVGSHQSSRVLRADTEGARSAWHCGHAKQNQFCEERFIAPTDETCERRFLYTMNGDALAADLNDARAAYMLELLGMNATSLSGWRKAELERDFRQRFRRNGDGRRTRTARGNLPAAWARRPLPELWTCDRSPRGADPRFASRSAAAGGCIARSLLR